MLYSDESIKRYLDDLASKLPVPGGGSAAAVASSLASALNSMVLNFTAGNEKCLAVEKHAKQLLAQSEKYRAALIGLIQADVNAYQAVAAAYRLSKSTENEKQTRGAAIQTALKKAALVSQQLAEMSYAVLELSQDILPVGNANLVSDLGVAVVLAGAAMHSALINAEINMKGIKDAKFSEQMRERIKPMIKAGAEIKNNVYEEVLKRIKLE